MVGEERWRGNRDMKCCRDIYSREKMIKFKGAVGSLYLYTNLTFVRL